MSSFEASVRVYGTVWLSGMLKGFKWESPSMGMNGVLSGRIIRRDMDLCKAHIRALHLNS